jgi:hypothetical protein
MAATHIGHLGAIPQLGFYAIEGRQPVLDQVVEVAGAEEPRR